MPSFQERSLTQLPVLYRLEVTYQFMKLWIGDSVSLYTLE